MGKKDGKKRSRAGSGGEGGSKRSKAPPGLPSAKDIAAAAASIRGRGLEEDGRGHAKSAAPASSSSSSSSAASSSSSSSASGSSSSSSSSGAGGITTTTKAARDVSKTGWNAPMEGLKSGHWSKTEDAALKQTISEYLENRDGLTLEQLIKQKEHKTSGSGSAPWLDIAESFPLRHVRSVYYRAQRLMNDDNYSGIGAVASAAPASAPGASIISSVNHYESSHLHATLGPALASLPPPPPPRGCLNQKNNQASTTSAWRKLLSSVFQSGATNTTARGGHNAATTAASAIRPRPLTLGHYHHHRLNAENTLRLEAHRQLFQFSDYHMHHQDNDQQMRPSSQSQRGPQHQQQPLHPQPSQPSARGHFCSNDSSLQYYASVGFRVFLLYIA